jgi:nucleotidyltransferase/DNA polymerase involved in DNA repair
VKSKKKAGHARRRGLGQRFKARLKKLGRKTVVNRWSLMSAIRVIEFVGWVIKRFGSDSDHPDLSP